MDDYDEEIHPKYYMMDASQNKPGYIPTNIQIPPEGTNMAEQLVCAMNYPYVYGGNDNGTILLLCPHACEKCNCPMNSA